MQHRQPPQQRQLRRIQANQWHRRRQRDRRYRPSQSQRGHAADQLHPSARAGAQHDTPPPRPQAHVGRISFSIWNTDGMRSWLAICITLLVAIVALVAAYETSADGVFGKLLPILTLVLGYYFGKGTAGSG